MPVFYTLHTIFDYFEVDKQPDGSYKRGARNCKIFLLGSLIYVILFCLIANINLRVNKFFESFYIYKDMIFVSLVTLMILDIATMAYTYKIKFNRYIMNELFENPDNSPYDYVDGKYIFNHDKELQLYLNDVVLKTVKEISRKEIEDYLYDLRNQEKRPEKRPEKNQIEDKIEDEEEDV